MRWLKRWSKKAEHISEKAEKNFAKGKRLNFLYPLFDAIDTFILTTNEKTIKGSHIRDAVDMKRMMTCVLIALMPALLMGIWNVGYQHFLAHATDASIFQCFWYGFWQVLPIIITVYVSGLAVEIIFAKMRNHQVAEGFFVTGLIIPMIMPPDIPLWVVSMATIFSVIFCKEVFGGNGYNFLNPALVARAFIFFAYPKTISGTNVWVANPPDAYTMATPLANISTTNHELLPSQLDMLIGSIPGSIGEVSKIAILLGAAFMIFTRVASFRVMLSVVLGGLFTTAVVVLFGENAYADTNFLTHLLTGGFLFGAVFMATDPVSGPHTNIGKWIYGFLIGAVAILIRLVNKGYPEGMMLAILLMNSFAPLIDYCVVRVHVKRRGERFAR